MQISTKFNTNLQNYKLNTCSESSRSTDDQFTQDHFFTTRPNINICKYKTQICKNYSQMGHCPYWQKCQFAHGPEDLCWKQPVTKKFYRTRQCKPFWDKYSCNYGFRCQFSHYECSKIDKLGRQFLNLAKHFYNCQKRQNASRLLQILKNH